MMSFDHPDVSVVIPAYDAAATIMRTLRSVQAQVDCNLEIILVDDGSTDNTRELVENAAEDDSRIRVLSQRRSGVAAARNAGIDAARGVFVAPLDADDVWAQDKLAKQLRIAADARECLGFVYCFYRVIDIHDRVVATPATWQVDGYGLCRLISRNFVGNGSALLIPRAAFGVIGGYDPRLRQLGLEGTEDWKLQLQLSAKYPIRCCPEYLVGYRRHPHSMSTDQSRMLRAMLYVLEEQIDALPELPSWVAESARARRRVSGLRTLLRSIGLSASATLLARSVRASPSASARAALDVLRRKLRRHRSVADRTIGMLFQDLATNATDGQAFPNSAAARQWRLLEKADELMAASRCPLLAATIDRKSV